MGLNVCVFVAFFSIWFLSLSCYVERLIFEPILSQLDCDNTNNNQISNLNVYRMDFSFVYFRYYFSIDPKKEHTHTHIQTRNGETCSGKGSNNSYYLIKKNIYMNKWEFYQK